MRREAFERLGVALLDGWVDDDDDGNVATILVMIKTKRMMLRATVSSPVHHLF